MNPEKFRVIITQEWRQTQYGVRQPGCTNHELLSCRVQKHPWCRNHNTLNTAMNTARVYATLTMSNTTRSTK